MTPVTKIMVTVAGVGVIGSSVGIGMHLMNYSTITDRLTSEGFELAISEEEWAEIAKAHNTAQKNFFEGTKKNDVNWIKERCKETLSKRDKDKTNYKLGRQWCVKPETISTILGKKLKVLITETAVTDDDAWKEKIKNLSSNDKASLNVTIGSEEAANIKDIKAKCKAVTDKKTIDVEFNEKFEIVKRVCTLPKNDN